MEGVEIGNRVLVGSDFHPAREEVIREAKRRSGATEATVYVGDGLWDVRAARALGMPFVASIPRTQERFVTLECGMSSKATGTSLRS